MASSSDTPSWIPIDPEDTPFERLIADLRSLEMIPAPSDFEYRLKQRIASEPPETTRWWKRVFLFSNSSFMGVPSYAYGSLVVVLVAVLSIYVYRSSTNTSDLFTPTSDGTMSPSSSLPEETIFTPDQSAGEAPQPVSEESKISSPPPQPQKPTETRVQAGANEVQSNEYRKKEEASQPAPPAQRRALIPTESEERTIQQALPALRSVTFDDEKDDDEFKKRDSTLKADSLTRVGKTLRDKSKNQRPE